jgi:hypothetical protein
MTLFGGGEGLPGPCVYGLLVAQLALALTGQDRAQVLSQILELRADRELMAASGGSRR